MTKGDRKIFNNKTTLYQMVNLRFVGFSTDSLATFFSCKKPSIDFQLERYGIEKPETVYSLTKMLRTALINTNFPKTREWKLVDGERIAVGKSYKDYLK